MSVSSSSGRLPVHGDGGVAGLGDGGDHGPPQPLPVRCLDSARRQAAPAPRQAGLAHVRAGKASLGPGVGHRLRVTEFGYLGLEAA